MKQAQLRASSLWLSWVRARLGAHHWGTLFRISQLPSLPWVGFLAEESNLGCGSGSTEA